MVLTDRACAFRLFFASNAAAFSVAVFTEKAEDEHLADGLAREDVIEAVVNAPALYKTLRSASASRGRRRELLYVILGITHEGILVYTKGALRRHGREEHFYVFVSAKRSVDE